MTTITIDEYVNAYGLRGYDSKDGYFLNETHEERLEMLMAVKKWLDKEIIEEYKRRAQYAGQS